MLNTLTALISLPLLYLSGLFYFQLADKYNIIDKPNERSSHNTITIRGGGVIFIIAALIFFVFSGFQYPYFFAGLIGVSTVSFLDDIYTLPNRYRLPFQFFSILAIFYQLRVFLPDSIVFVAIALIVCVGIMNAYNFMDGINGITGGYSLLLIFTLYIINNFSVYFIENEFLQVLISGLLVFNYFNFRNKAMCFAGDVGSISMAVIILFLLLKLILHTQNYIFILLLLVYGIDSSLTIVQRLWRKENIFKAHRLHLFQLMVSEWKLKHISTTLLYLLAQLIINMGVFMSFQQEIFIQKAVSIGLIVFFGLLYIYLKSQILKTKNNLKH